MDDSMFPRVSMESPTINTLSTSDSNSHTGVASDYMIRVDTKTKNVDATTQQESTVITEGSVSLPPRTYLQILIPVHYFKEDPTTFVQYFRRPFVLFSFPNVVLVRSYLGNSS